jgi:hypothetical protein
MIIGHYTWGQHNNQIELQLQTQVYGALILSRANKKQRCKGRQMNTMSNYGIRNGTKRVGINFREGDPG